MHVRRIEKENIIIIIKKTTTTTTIIIIIIIMQIEAAHAVEITKLVEYV
jgi:hypothetical protein